MDELLNLIYNEYETNKTVKEVIDFDEAFIKPLLEKDHKMGIKMEEMFNIAIAESETQAFKNGFTLCMHFMMDFIKNDL